MRRVLIGVLMALVLVLAGCGGEDDPAPRRTPTPDADRTKAAAAFAKAYATFRSDFDAATAIGEDDGLKNATASVRAVRDAYFELDAAARRIEFPDDVRPDVNVMLGSIGELIAALDKQGATTTSEDFQAAGPASSAALQQADDAIRVVAEDLGVGTGEEAGPGPSGTTKQRRVDVGYLDGGAVRNAKAWVDDLLRIGASNVDHEVPAEDMGIVVAWRAAFPEVLGESGVVGSERRAPTNGVSGFVVLTKDDKREAGPDNPYYLAFAVRDASGRCAGGVLSGHPDPTDRRAVQPKDGARCSGAEVARAAGF